MPPANEDANDKALLIDLRRLALLPTHRVLISAALCDDGQAGGLGSVGDIGDKAKLLVPGDKARLLKPGDNLSALAVSSNQEGLAGLQADYGKEVLAASTLDELWSQIDTELGDHLYGPFVKIPEVLTVAGLSRSYDYRASSFQSFGWLDALVRRAILDPVTPMSADDPRLRDDGPTGNTIEKPWNRGYILLQGTAGSGKTSYGLNWVRRSRGDVQSAATDAPKLSGWYFARQFGAGGPGHLDHQDGISALQTLVSLARRAHDVVPGDGSRPELLSPEERDSYLAALPSGDCADHEAKLRSRFIKAIEQVAAKASATEPLVLLLDGVDELAPSGTGTHVQRSLLAKVLPTNEQLPAHVYIVLVSRLGLRLTQGQGKRPLLRYQFSAEEVAKAICAYLTRVADQLAQDYPANEASVILRGERLQRNVCAASGSAFGYAPLLIREWIGDKEFDTKHDIETLKNWEGSPKNLPDGVYGLRAREFIGMRDDVSAKDTQMDLAEAMALLTVLRWPLCERDLLEVIYPGSSQTPLHSQSADASRLRNQLNAAATWMANTDGKPEDAPLQFGHESLAEVARAAGRLHLNHQTIDEAALTAE
ncbi:MAG: hypothetical protein ABL900_14990, partial [Burkholderiaceae bacterium]